MSIVHGSVLTLATLACLAHLARADPPQEWVGVCTYQGETYPVSLLTSAEGGVLSYELIASVLGTADLTDVDLSEEHLRFRFERADTGVVETELTVRDGVARGASLAGGYEILRHCLVPALDLDPRELRSRVGVYEFEDGGAPIRVHTQGTPGSELFLSRYDPQELLELSPLSADRFLGGLEPEGSAVSRLELRFEGDRLVLVEGGRERMARKSGPDWSLDVEAVLAEAERWCSEHSIPSLAIGVVHRERILLSEAIGFADLEREIPASPATLYQLGSVAKPITTTIAAELVERGTIAWDDPVEQHLPEGASFDRIPKPHARRITLRRLAEHTSGLPRVSDFLRSKTEGPTAEDLNRSIRQVRLALLPGVKEVYSNFGGAVLGYALEGATGSSYEQLARDHVFEPLGMEASTFLLDEQVEAGLAVHYWPDDYPRRPRPPVRFGARPGSGGLVSNVEDMCRFLEFQLGGGPEDDRLLEPDQLFRAPAEDRGTVPGWLVETRSGIGWVVSHGGECDGHSAQVAFSPSTGVGIVVLGNIGGADLFPFADWLLREVVSEARVQTPPDLAALEHANWAGRHAEAAAGYEYLAAHDPDSGRVWYRLAVARFGLREIEAAEVAYRRALELGYAAGECHVGLARIQALRGATEPALRSLLDGLDAGYSDRYALEAAPELSPLLGEARLRSRLK